MVFCLVRKFFFGQHKSQNIFFCRAKREFFFQILTLGYMTKTLNQIIFFSSTKIRIFFSATLGMRIFFQKKTIIPPFKLNGRSLIVRFIDIRGIVGHQCLKFFSLLAYMQNSGPVIGIIGVRVIRLFSFLWLID